MGNLSDMILNKLLLFTFLIIGIQAYELTIVHLNDLHSNYDHTSVLTKDCTEESESRDECVGGEARRATVIKETRANHLNTLVLDAGDRFIAYELTIVHLNDLHSNYDHTSVLTKDCTEELKSRDECVGGEARRATVIKETRVNHPNTLVLDAGDRFIGTIWFKAYRGNASSYFLNAEGFDAVCLGNHDFDLGLEVLVPYLNNITAEVVTANMDISREPSLQGLVKRSTVMVRGGEKIGIVGVTTKDTSFLSSAGPTVDFTDEIEAVKVEVQQLRAAGIKIILVLSHAGYEMDLRIAAEVEGVDVIVGGHSHTFLYTGEQPSTDEIIGPYPTVVEQTSDRKVLVVQAFAYGKYLGLINVNFDASFEVESWTGNPILLDNTVQQDAAIQADIERMRGPVQSWITNVVGSTAVTIDGDCRHKECNSGNLINDAFVWYHIKQKRSNDTWALAPMAVKNSGSIKATLEPGPITQSQVLSLLPYADSTTLIRTNGSYIWQAFEHSVANYDPLETEGPGPFLQVSGIRVVYNLLKPAGNRVVSLKVLCHKCCIPSYSPLEKNKEYSILLDDWLIRGGGGYNMFKGDNVIEHVKLNSPVADSVTAYLKAHDDVFPDVEGRITFVENECHEREINAAGYASASLALVFVCLFYAML